MEKWEKEWGRKGEKRGGERSRREKELPKKGIKEREIKRKKGEGEIKIKKIVIKKESKTKKKEREREWILKRKKER